jgi:GT2 family glycosyltransferase
LSEDGDVLRSLKAPPWSAERLRQRCFISLPAVFFRRRLIERFGGPDAGLAYHADYEFWLRLAEGGSRFAPLSELLADRRLHPQSRRMGTSCPKHRAAAAAEMNEILARRTGRLSQRLIMRYADAEAHAEGKSRNGSIDFDWAVMKHAARSERIWNRRFWSFPVSLVGLACRHVGKELEHIARRPHLATRFLPRPVRGIVENRLRHKIFRTRHYDPRAIRLPAGYHRPWVLRDPPVVSIVTPNLNQGEYLADTIRSVVGQGYPRLEYIVQDGGSTDNSLEVIRQYEGQLAHWESHADGGQAIGINRGMQHATGKIMAFLNADDLLLPGSLAYVAAFFQKHPDVDVVYGHRLLIDEKGLEIGRWVLPAHDDNAIAYADYVPQETMFWRRRAWEKVGGQLDESFRFALDWDLILRFRSAGMQFVRLPRFLGAFRITAEQKTTQLIRTVGDQEMKRLRRRELGHNPTRREIRQALRPYMWRHWWCDTLHALGAISY